MDINASVIPEVLKSPPEGSPHTCERMCFRNSRIFSGDHRDGAQAFASTSALLVQELAVAHLPIERARALTLGHQDVAVSEHNLDAHRPDVFRRRGDLLGRQHVLAQVEVAHHALSVPVAATAARCDAETFAPTWCDHTISARTLSLEGSGAALR